MLNKKSRIPRKSFSDLLTNSKYVNSPDFSLRFILNQNTSNPRIGVSVSKKISKSAVVRNTTRRRIYSALRGLITNLPNGTFLFVVKNGGEKIKGEKLAQELYKLLEKVI